MIGAPEPVAWLLRETKGGTSRIMCGKVFMREEAALPAAERETNTWRDVNAVPVFAEPLPQPEPVKSWRCFHCGEVFLHVDRAAAHFGVREDQTPACQIKASEGGLVRALREAEDECERVHTQLHAESADGLRALQNNLGRHRTAMIAQEETGYERGLADQARTVAILRRALAWHGDPQRMATAREEWQQEIDEAIRWVRDNPEEGRPSFSSFNSGVDPTRAPMGALRALRDGQEQADMEGERVKVSRQAVDEVVTWAAVVLGGEQ